MSQTLQPSNQNFDADVVEHPFSKNLECGRKRRKISESSEDYSQDSLPSPKRNKTNKREKNRKAAIECRK